MKMLCHVLAIICLGVVIHGTANAQPCWDLIGGKSCKDEFGVRGSSISCSSCVLAAPGAGGGYQCQNRVFSEFAEEADWEIKRYSAVNATSGKERRLPMTFNCFSAGSCQLACVTNEENPIPQCKKAGPIAALSLPDDALQGGDCPGQGGGGGGGEGEGGGIS